MTNGSNSTLSPELQQQLSQLRDIHLPEPISWWPLAIGWWVLIALGALVIIFLVIMQKRRRVYRAAIRELNSLTPRKSHQLSNDLSALLKRVALYRGHTIASLGGRDWSNYLVNTGFTQEQADFIALGSYSEVDESNIPEWESLKAHSKQWIRDKFREKSRAML